MPWWSCHDGVCPRGAKTSDMIAYVRRQPFLRDDATGACIYLRGAARQLRGRQRHRSCLPGSAAGLASTQHGCLKWASSSFQPPIYARTSQFRILHPLRYCRGALYWWPLLLKCSPGLTFLLPVQIPVTWRHCWSSRRRLTILTQPSGGGRLAGILACPCAPAGRASHAGPTATSARLISAFQNARRLLSCPSLRLLTTPPSHMPPCPISSPVSHLLSRAGSGARSCTWAPSGSLSNTRKMHGLILLHECNSRCDLLPILPISGVSHLEEKISECGGLVCVCWGCVRECFQRVGGGSSSHTSHQAGPD